MNDKQAGDIDVWGVIISKALADIVKVCIMAAIVIAFIIGCISYAVTSDLDTAIRWTAGGFGIGMILSVLTAVGGISMDA